MRAMNSIHPKTAATVMFVAVYTKFIGLGFLKLFGETKHKRQLLNLQSFPVANCKLLLSKMKEFILQFQIYHKS